MAGTAGSEGFQPIGRPDETDHPGGSPMLSVTDLRDAAADTDLDAVVPRAEVDVSSTVSAVLPIIEQVRTGGASAVPVSYTHLTLPTIYSV